MTGPLDPQLAAAVVGADIPLEPLPLEPGQILEGDPQTSIAVLDVSPDGRVERGIWEITPGTVTDEEADEMFVVLSGRATVEVQGGPVMELAAGTVGVLRAGDRTVWRVSETLRKAYQVTHAPAG